MIRISLYIRTIISDLLPCSIAMYVSKLGGYEEKQKIVAVEDIVTCKPISNQRLGKRIPETGGLKNIRHPLLGNGPINKHSLQQKKVFSLESVSRSYLADNRSYRS
jgi:hypothetical protein